MNIVCIGDSLTKGYGINPSNCWVSILGREAGLPVINKGVLGDTSTGILSRFSRDVKKGETSKVLIMCGTNDALLYRNMRNVSRNIDAMISEALANEITPIILFPPQILKEIAVNGWDSKVDYDRTIELLSNLKVMIQDIVKEKNVEFIDLSILMEPKAEYYSDGVHLSNLGNNFVYNILKDKLA
ncbi:MAG: GDSL-type esterase/lipase family protein [Sarcina sp.]